MLTPMDIHAKEFGKSFRGFDENEVNEFLNEVMKAYATVLDERDQLRAELAREQETVDEFRRIEQSMRETLIVAQKTAEDVMESAKKNADHTLELAAKEAQNMRREATLQAKAQLDDAAARVRVIVAANERLVREKHQFLRRMKGNVQAELALIEDAIAEMPDMVAEKKETSRMVAEQHEDEEDV